jgi:S-adenosylmethionine:tRNA ribosyltransferase-isomerase
MTVDDFDYHLPPELIAQYPEPQRDASRMLVLDREAGDPRIAPFAEFAALLRPGDCLVLNDTRVIPARLRGRREPTGGAVEALLLEEESPGTWRAMLKPGKRLRPGSIVRVADSASFEVLGRDADIFCIRFDTPDVPALLEACGSLPLPPYMRRAAESSDSERYQTVYAARPGAVAAPTAGLHFTPDILTEIASRDIAIAHLTLHVGHGTFKPVDVKNVCEHRMHAEQFELSEEAADLVNSAERVVAVGTTSVRVLESCAEPDGTVTPQTGNTDIFLYPPYKPRAVDCLLTNFHLPRSTLLMLVSTFATRERVFSAYQIAIQEKMRFYSYGDCMLLT